MPVETASREFIMTDSDYGKIKKMAMLWTGISLSDQKKNMIYGRLSRRLRHLSLNQFSEYCRLLEESPEAEKRDFINAITTNLTSFFREQHHFDFLYDDLLKQLLVQNKATRKIRIWSAGCSTGEEPYSISMVINNCKELAGWDVKILATDLDTNVISTAKSGIYSCEKAEKIPKQYQAYFKSISNGNEVEISKVVKDVIRFKPLNLLEKWPMKNSFDIIFCRNVVIYFNIETQKKLFDRYFNALDDSGHLFIGHSENLYKVTNKFTGIGRTIYKKRLVN